MKRREAAFRFIPELIDNYERVMKLSKNPKLLYVEAAVNTLHMVADVFKSIEEHINIRQKEEVKEALSEKYSELKKMRIGSYIDEAVHNIDLTYESLKIQIGDGKFQNVEVRKFILCLKEELHKVIELFNEVQIDPDYNDREKVEEITRKTIRDYQKLLTIFIEEEKRDDQAEYE